MRASALKLLSFAAVFSCAAIAAALEPPAMQTGNPEIKQAGALAFAPEGVLLIGDSQGAAIFAVDTADKAPAGSAGTLKLEGFDEKIATGLGTTADQLLINDLAVNPASGNIYVSVSKGKGPDSPAAIVRVTPGGKIEEVSLKNVKFAKAALENASVQKRQEAITDIGYADRHVIVAGLSNEEFASKLRAIPYPFAGADAGASVEIYHGAHGKLETSSPVRTFLAHEIKGQTHVLAAYTCTPLVKFPLSDLKPGAKVRGVTLAELGNRNRPLDMIAYKKDGKDFILIANSSRGVMKVSTDGLESQESIDEKVSGTAGLKYDTVKDWQGVLHLDKLDDKHAVLLQKDESGKHTLQAVELP